MDSKSEDGRISEEKAALVLDRATQLDATRGREMSIAELREVALEAGISPEAFERALAEVRGMREGTLGRSVRANDPGTAVEDAPSLASSILYRAKILVGGLAIGLFSAILLDRAAWGDAGILFGLVIALFVAIGLMLNRRREGAVLDFEIDLASFWVGLTFVFMLTARGEADEALAMMSLLGGVTALAGAAMVALPSVGSKPKALPEET